MEARGRGALAALVAALAGAAPAFALAASPAQQPSAVAPQVRQFAAGVLQLRDNEGRPFAVVDKQRAQLHVFDAGGRLRGSTAVLLGQARGDRSAPEVGVHTQAGRVPWHERTTPAGRFVAEPGRNLAGEHIVWVDYEAAFAIHRLRPGASYKARAARLATTTTDDNRASWGCVVVPVDFYRRVVAQLLGRGTSIVYVLPEQDDRELPSGLPRARTARLRPTGTDHPG